MIRRLLAILSALSLLLLVSTIAVLAVGYAHDYYIRFTVRERDVLLRPSRSVLKLQIAQPSIWSDTSLRPEVWVEELRNEDIQWSGGTLGYMPHAVGEPAVRLADIGQPARPVLFAALDDPKKFAAAHVLLTWTDARWSSTFPRWNGLTPPGALGRASDYDTTEMPAIQAFWQARIAPRTIAIPLWPWLILFAASPALRLFSAIRERQSRRAGLCPRCDYDLRATPDRCPECGHTPGVTSHTDAPPPLRQPR